MKIMEKFLIIIIVGVVFFGYIVGEMIFKDKVVGYVLEGLNLYLYMIIFILLVILVVVVGKFSGCFKKEMY